MYTFIHGKVYFSYNFTDTEVQILLYELFRLFLFSFYLNKNIQKMYFYMLGLHKVILRVEMILRIS